ncbi:MAG: CAP domain-containing protein [Acidobacteria bacterium]|nr:CAP domain-containing protein [Acidobacteriota bacterium]
MSKVRDLSKPRRRVLSILLVVIAALVLSACTPQQETAMDLVNATRAEHGLDPLYPHHGAMQKAQAWAEELASRDGHQLDHSKLSNGIAGDWLKIGENVGYGGSIEIVQNAYMKSPGHRANILDPSFNFMGVGVVERQDGFVFTVQVFVRYALPNQ